MELERNPENISSNSCPICGLSDIDISEQYYLRHMNCHTKNSLSLVLYRQRDHMASHSNSSTSNSLVSEDHEQDMPNTGNNEGTESNQPHRRKKTPTRSPTFLSNLGVPQYYFNKSVSCQSNKTGVRGVGILEQDLDRVPDTEVERVEPCGTDVVPVNGTTVPLLPLISKPTMNTFMLPNEFGNLSLDALESRYLTETSVAAEETPVTIKYIVDQEQRQTKTLVLADGRAIPVYAFAPQMSSSISISKNTATQYMEENAQCSMPVAVEVNLMSDEVFPSRGEISEFEESNTSSLISEDSNIKSLGGFFSDPCRFSPVVDSCSNSGKKKQRSIEKKSENEVYCLHRSFEKAAFPVRSILVTQSKDSDSNSRPDELSKDLNEPHKSLNNVPVQAAPIKEKTFFCVYCEYLSKTNKDLQQHMTEKHPARNPKPEKYECTKCAKQFNARTNLRKHLMTHNEKQHECNVCNKKFASNYKLKEHYRVHTKDYPFPCLVSGCTQAYRTKSLLNTHSKTKHQDDRNLTVRKKIEFVCETCQRVLHSKRSLDSHRLGHAAKPKKCSMCPEMFARHSVLVRHMRINHDPQFESKNSTVCDVCKKKLHPNSLKKHMRIHQELKPFKCTICDKKFRTQGNLASHAWAHKPAEKPFKCQQCPKSYVFEKSLKAHVAAHSGRLVYPCNECGVKFTHKVNMKRHSIEHRQDKRYECKYKDCKKKFHRSYYLNEHSRTHTGLKPFHCTACGKQSATKSNHRAHMKIHEARELGGQEG